jgi:ribonucleotide monophosphatase NagD (HAD superfamily)
MALVEGSLKTRLHPSLLPPIARLGKPFPEIFAEAARRAGGGKLALVGDQLGTDILGAKNAGMDAVLVGTGLTQVRPGETLEPAPHFLLPNLAL